MRTALVALICLALLAACDMPHPFSSDIGEHRFGETFSTSAGKTEMIERKVIVSFIAVVEDSRCPKRVTCIWQGEVKVRIGVMLRDETQSPAQREVVLSTLSDAAGTATIQGFRVELVDVSPYPEEGGPIVSAKYSVTLRVTRE